MPVCKEFLGFSFNDLKGKNSPYGVIIDAYPSPNRGGMVRLEFQNKSYTDIHKDKVREFIDKKQTTIRKYSFFQEYINGSGCSIIWAATSWGLFCLNKIAAEKSWIVTGFIILGSIVMPGLNWEQLRKVWSMEKAEDRVLSICQLLALIATIAFLAFFVWKPYYRF